MTIGVSGGTGFIGRHLLNELSANGRYELLAMSRSGAVRETKNVSSIHGSLEDEHTLRQVMRPGGLFVHLAFPPDWPIERHRAAARRLGETAARAGVKRFIHCSTAIVVGNPGVDAVTEETPCKPLTSYEQSKLEIERVLRESMADAVELIVVRPTAVFGPSGMNLVKLAQSLTSGSATTNYLRSSLFGHRRMNLVCLDNVIGALRFLIDRPTNSGGETFLVSDDDEPANNFRDVEITLMQLLGVRGYAVPQLPVPAAMLTLALRAAGRASASPHRVYEATRLRQAGYRKRASLAEGLHRFAEWFKSR